MKDKAVRGRLVELAALARRCGYSDLEARATATIETLDYDKVHVVVVGEFNRGKTTLVNALIGEPILPMGIVPTTAALWVIEEGVERTATIVRADGSTKSISADPAELARLSADGDLCSPDIRLIRITVPQLFLGRDVVLIDTPGVNDLNQQRAEITYEVVGRADAAVFVLDASSPVSKSESTFLKGQVLDAHLQKMLFVLNKIDRVEDEVDASLDSARERLQSILERTPDVVPCDARAGLSGRVSALVKVRDGLVRLLEAARDEHAREEVARLRHEAIASELIRRLESRRKSLTLTANENARERERFEAEHVARAERFQRLLDHIRTHGRDRLKALVATSLEAACGEFVTAQRVRISTMKGDFKAFANTVLPFEIQTFTKRWLDGHGPQIDGFLREFASHISQECERNFGQAFAFETQVTIAPRAQPVSKSSVEDPNDYISMGLPAGGLVAGSLLIGGPLAGLGLAAGLVIAKLIRDNSVKSAQDRLLSEFPSVVEESLQATLSGLHAGVDDWFRVLEERLLSTFTLDANRLRTELDRAAGATATQNGADAAETDASLVTTRRLTAG